MKENRNYEQFGDIRNDTFIVHYPGTFLKTRDEHIEQQVYRSDRDVPLLWNFTDSYLLEFIAMYYNIKKISQSQTTKDKIIPTTCKPRVQRSEMKKIKYKKKR